MRRTAGAVLAAALLLTGCTSDDDVPAGAADPTTSATATATSDPSSGDVTSQDLSEQVLDAAVAAGERAPVASQTVDSKGEQLTVDVVEIRRTRDGVLAEFRLSSPAPDVTVGPSRFEEDRLGSIYAVTGVFLEDPAAGVRYRPLRYDDERRGVECVCPIRPLKLGPEPQAVYALFPPMPPEVSTVTFRMFEAFDVPGIAVT